MVKNDLEINNAEIQTEPDEAELKYQSAVKFVAMADCIMLSRFREKYYQEAINILQELQDNNSSGIDVVPLLNEAEHKINEARAHKVVEKYDFACKSREYATTQEDLGSAALHFREAAAELKKVPVMEGQLSPECRARYEECKKAEERAKECEKNATATYRKGRVRLIGILLVLCLLVGGLLSVRKTVTFRTMLGKVELALGMNDQAIKNLKRALNRKESDETYQNYVDGLLEAGMDAVRKGKTEEVSEYLHLPALEGNEQAAVEVTKAEISLIADAEIEDVVLFAGVKWIVLDKDVNGNVLMILQEAISGIPYADETASSFTWEDSTARAYLNGAYLQEQFNSQEVDHILLTQVSAAKNPDFQTPAGQDTQDLLYLLSIEEYEKYAEIINKCGNCQWLRTPGATEGMAVFVGTYKDIMVNGYEGSTDAFCLKPVLWLKTK